MIATSSIAFTASRMSGNSCSSVCRFCSYNEFCSHSLVAIRTDSGENWSGMITGASCSSMQRWAFINWSAIRGIKTTGKLRSSPKSRLLLPPCIIIKSHYGSSSVWGIYRSICTLAGCAPKSAGSLSRPRVTIKFMGSSRSPSIMVWITLG